MILQRPLIDHNTECSLDVPFAMCEYHWEITASPYMSYRTTLDEAREGAYWLAYTCPDCEDPVW